MADERELDELMARLSRGERDAFEPLYAELAPRALRYAGRRLSRADAEDAAQAALVNVFSRASEFTAGRAVMPWFYAIVLNEVRAVLRKHGRTTSLDEVLEPPSVGADAHAVLEERQAHARLAEAIDALEPSSRDAIRSRLGGDAASTTGAAALRKRLSRAYARLRLLMGVADEL